MFATAGEGHCGSKPRRTRLEKKAQRAVMEVPRVARAPQPTLRAERRGGGRGSVLIGLDCPPITVPAPFVVWSRKTYCIPGLRFLIRPEVRVLIWAEVSVSMPFFLFEAANGSAQNT